MWAWNPDVEWDAGLEKQLGEPEARAQDCDTGVLFYKSTQKKEREILGGAVWVLLFLDFYH